MDEKEVLSQVADTLLDNSVTFEVEGRPFEIKPSTLGTMVKISKELLAMDLSAFDKDKMLESNFNLIIDHSKRMCIIVAYAVTNKKAEPPDELVEFFEDNLTAAELFKLVNIIISQLDVINFMKSIISVKGVNILTGMNPKTQGSKIASGESLEE